MKKILLSWSSGKDSAWTLHVLRQRGEYDIVGLLTTVNAAADRVAMHGVRRELLEAQASAAGLPRWILPLPWPCSNDDYERVMRSAVDRAVGEGIYGIAFGDLFLEDVRTYRERQLAGTGLKPIFPIWGMDTAGLAREMISSGLRARLTCVDTQALPASFAGREFDEQLLADLDRITAIDLRVEAPPKGASTMPRDTSISSGVQENDKCGERGEFHTFCYAGPMFSLPIPISRGEVIVQERFAFADLLLAKPVIA